MSRFVYILTAPLCLVCRTSALVLYTREQYRHEMEQQTENQRLLSESLAGGTIVGLLAIAAHSIVKTL